MDNDNELPPGWTPDLMWAAREFDSQSVEKQEAIARKRWAIDPENPANQAPAGDEGDANPQDHDD